MRQIFAKGDAKTIRKLEHLLKSANSDGYARVANRMRAIILSIEQRSSSEIASALRVDRTRVPVWINNWNCFGEEGLLEGYRPGRTPKLNASKLEKLHDIIESGPLAYGLDSGIWTSIIVAQIIENEFDISYHPGHVRKLLQEMGFSVQRPTVSLARAEQEPKNRWIRYLYPDLKKKLKKKVVLSSTVTKHHSVKTQQPTKPGQKKAINQKSHR